MDFSAHVAAPLAAPKCLTYGRVKMPHLAVGGTRDDYAI